MPIQISVYPDQIYIWNIGELPDAIPAERLYEKHPSLPRNPHIASAFFKTGMVECWGRGYEKVADACLAAGIELSNVRVGFGGLMVHITESEQHKRLRLAYESGGGQSGGQKLDMTEREAAVLAQIEVGPYLSAEGVAERINVSKRSVERTIRTLRDKGKIPYVGSSKDGYWFILE